MPDDLLGNSGFSSLNLRIFAREFGKLFATSFNSELQNKSPDCLPDKLFVDSEINCVVLVRVTNKVSFVVASLPVVAGIESSRRE